MTYMVLLNSPSYTACRHLVSTRSTWIIERLGGQINMVISLSTGPEFLTLTIPRWAAGPGMSFWSASELSLTGFRCDESGHKSCPFSSDYKTR